MLKLINIHIFIAIIMLYNIYFAIFASKYYLIFLI